MFESSVIKLFFKFEDLYVSSDIHIHISVSFYVLSFDILYCTCFLLFTCYKFEHLSLIFRCIVCLGVLSVPNLHVVKTSFTLP